MNRTPMILGTLLAASLLFNAVAFVRLSESEAPVAPPKASVPAAARKPVPPEPAPEAAALPRSVDPAPKAPEAAAAPVRMTSAAPAAGSALRHDPKVREVLQAN